MSRHATFLLGQALEALTRVEDATTLSAARRAASEALAGIQPSERDWPGVERGAGTPLIGDGATPPATERQAGQRLVAAECATGARTPSAPSPLSVVPDSVACGHVRGSLVCDRGPHAGPGGHVYVHPSWVPDRHQGAS